ncbi:MAG: hypothetical protein ACRDTE_19110 [Pseudonocardiaceae bacterium]
MVADEADALGVRSAHRVVVLLRRPSIGQLAGQSRVGQRLFEVTDPVLLGAFLTGPERG